jgi:surfactin synthase thioesterase subunit
MSARKGAGVAKASKPLAARAQAALDEIVAALASGQKTLCPAIFSHCYGRAAASAAFRVAKQRGIVEVAYIGGTGTPNYRAAGIGAAIIQQKSSTQH